MATVPLTSDGQNGAVAVRGNENIRVMIGGAYANQPRPPVQYRYVFDSLCRKSDEGPGVISLKFDAHLNRDTYK